MGAPRLPKELSYPLHVRVTQADAARFAKLAKEQGLPAAAMLRKVIVDTLDAADREAGPARGGGGVGNGLETRQFHGADREAGAA